MNLRTLALAGLLLCGFSAAHAAAETATTGPAAIEVTTPALAPTTPTAEAAPTTAARVLTPPPPLPPELANAEPTTVAASHILFRYFTSRDAKTLLRYDEVRPLALAALERVRRPGADFEAIAKELEKTLEDVHFSRTGPFSRGKLVYTFEDTVFALPPGAIADHLTSTPFGLHIIRRNPTVHVRHILIQYDGAARATTTRPRAMARQLIGEIRQEALAPGADFAALARKLSEAPDAAAGGDVGVFDRGIMIQAFEDAAFALRYNEVSPVIETRHGFHILKRIG